MSRDPFATDAGEVETAPAGGVFESQFAIAAATAAALLALSIGGMAATADTIVAEFVLGIFLVPVVGPLLGVLTFGLLLAGGRYAGMYGLDVDDLAIGAVGAAVCVAAYAAFGGAVLTLYDSALYAPALALAGAAVLLIAAGAAAYVYATDRDLSHWETYARYCFLPGLGAVVLATVLQLTPLAAAATPLYLVAFAAFLLGFVCDLVYEIWTASSGRRRPLVNGLALYVAVAGVFVHVLQIAVELAEWVLEGPIGDFV